MPGHEVHHIDGALSAEELDRLCREVLIDPVVDEAVIDGVTPAQGRVVEVALMPGATDPDARELERAAANLGLPEIRVVTARRYDLIGDLSDTDVATLTRRLLANDTIEISTEGELPAEFAGAASADVRVDDVPLAELSDDDLLRLSKDRVLSLDLTEMQAIQAHFAGEGRPPTDAELETLAQTWSEHCVHKTFRARINLTHTSSDGEVTVSFHDGLLPALREVTEALDPPWLRSAFVDDAGIVAFDDHHDVAFKVETHNHPSALEPFGGANTGVGGVVRDVIGVSARPIACTDVLCFGPADLPDDELPTGVLHPRRIRDGVVAGIGDYGNKLGLPTVNGSVLYDPGYVGNPLVYCGALGILPHGSHPTEPQVGDRIISLGGRVGRDGIHGATFSSAGMDASTVDHVGSAVQIGDPITEKGLIEVIERARDARLYNAITDCGAGGFSSSVGEMGEDLGVEVDLSVVPLKYPGLQPWEIWISEAQERIVIAVPPAKLETLQSLCDAWDVEVTDLGRFTGDHRLVVRHGDTGVVDMPMAFLHDGIPRQELVARGPTRLRARSPPRSPPPPRCCNCSRIRMWPPRRTSSAATTTRSVAAPWSAPMSAPRPMVPPTQRYSSRSAPKATKPSCSPTASARLSADTTRTRWHCSRWTKRYATLWPSAAIPIRSPCSTTSVGATRPSPTGSVRSFAPCRVAPTALAPIGCRSSPARTRCSTSSMVKQSPAPC